MSGLNLAQIKNEIVRPTLDYLGLGGNAAVNLLTGTALAESDTTYLRQIGGGPALGLWQMEPATHDDCWVNFLCFPAQSRLSTKLEAMLAPDLPRQQQLITNLRYACAMARIRFYRVREPLPAADDPAGMSQYHKRWYNSPLGAANALGNIPDFKAAIAA
ncbi:hypothetical protein [Gluconobacter japonicus]|uniref:hypothetical protein n=1 Tax=Gluconobacter japonicus TaxID=376620 RepID=UPI000781AE78|nr:hypothetical protein [Gluconobacter japonicus]KXV20663.1 hypothetical protein AD935_11335 [Gluconobacter japonicus]